MKTRLLLLTLLGFLSFPGSAPILQAQTAATDDVGVFKTMTLTVGKTTMTAEVAATQAQEERGLMFRPKLADNAGMIFSLPVEQATFWMKNTLIPLSIAFLDKNGVILEIHDMKALDETITRSDSQQVAYALEANLHWFSLNGIKPGDKVSPLPSPLIKAQP